MRFYTQERYNYKIPGTFWMLVILKCYLSLTLSSFTIKGKLKNWWPFSIKYYLNFFSLLRYKAQPAGSPSDDPTPDYMNLLGMIFSMCGLMMKVTKLSQELSSCSWQCLDDIMKSLIFTKSYLFPGSHPQWRMWMLVSGSCVNTGVA